MNNQTVEKLAQPMLQFLLGVEAEGIAPDALFLDEFDNVVFDDAESVNDLMERNGLLEATPAQFLLVLPKFFGIAGEPVAEMFQNLLSSLAQFGVRQLAQVLQGGLPANFTKNPLFDLSMMGFDKADQLAGKHTLTSEIILHLFDQSANREIS
jgi:hypothetical protein